MGKQENGRWKFVELTLTKVDINLTIYSLGA